MNLNIDKYGGLTVVPIRCGSHYGTAFYVGKTQLITATHILKSHINNPKTVNIEVLVGAKWERCSIAAKFHPVDITLLNCAVESVDGDFLELLASEFFDGQDLKVIGYPKEIGNGIDYFGIDIKSTRELNDNSSRGFDIVVLRTDPLALASYNGFSGSPVFNHKGKVIGVATDQFYNTLSYASIKSIKNRLEFYKVRVKANSESYDITEYGLGRAQDLLEGKIKKAGERYSPETHVDNNDLNKKLLAFCTVGLDDKHKLALTMTRAIFDVARESFPKVYDFINGKKIFDLKNNPLLNYLKNGKYEPIIGDIVNSLIDYTPHGSNVKLIQNPLRTKVNKVACLMSELNEMDEYAHSKFMCITADAGQGKTHSLCHFAETNNGFCNFYLFFGTDFSDKDAEKTIIELMGWEKEGLEGLDAKMKRCNRYAIIIVDAVNEGSGSSYWETNLDLLKDKIATYGRIKLIVSFRNMQATDVLKEKINKNKTDWVYLDIPGFENTKAAVKTYFDKYYVRFNVEDAIKCVEFKSPLYLKIFCEVHHKLHYGYGNTTLPDRAIIYKEYLKKRNGRISLMTDEDPLEQVTLKCIEQIVRISFKNHLCFDVTRKEAKDIANAICPNRLWDKNLLNNLLKENILKEYSLKWKNNDRIDLIGFEYDSIGDYLKMRELLNQDSTDVSILEYIENGLAKIKLGMEMEAYKSPFANVLTYLFSEWEPDINVLTEKIFSNKLLKRCFIDSLPYQKFTEEYKGKLEPALQKLIEDNKKQVLNPENVVRNFSIYKYYILNELHKQLMDLDMSERDEVWTCEVNKLFDHYGLLPYLFDYYNTEKSNFKELAQLICWLMTTSYPVLKAKLVKLLKLIFDEQGELILGTIQLMERVNDPYIHQGLYSAAYASIVLSRDKDVAKEVATYLQDIYYKDKNSAPIDLVVRHWSMKIIELASYLNPDYSGWTELIALMPFDSVKDPFSLGDLNLPWEKDTFFGTDGGADSLHHSLFYWDFYRYIIGGNSNIYSPMFRFGENDGVLLRNVASAIAYIIRDQYKYSAALSEYDKSVYHGDRFNQNKERIGKKYQWLGYFQVLSYLCDHCLMRIDRYGEDERDASHNFPWLTGAIKRTDPTIPMEEDLSVYTSEKFALIPNDFKSIDSFEEWVSDEKLLPSLHHIIKDNEAGEWVILNAYDSQEVDSDGFRCDATVWYHGILIEDKDKVNFEKWCLPHNIDHDFREEKDYEYLWNDYPWAESYKARGHCKSMKEYLSAPCDVWAAYTTQLQEDFTGSNNDDEFEGSMDMPTEKIMSTLKLHTAERGIIKDDAGNVVAINICRSNRITSLVIKRELLNDFLDKSGMSLYYFNTSLKEVLGATQLFKQQRLKALFRYENIGDVRCLVPFMNCEVTKPSKIKSFDYLWEELINDIGSNVDADDSK